MRISGSPVVFEWRIIHRRSPYSVYPKARPLPTTLRDRYGRDFSGEFHFSQAEWHRYVSRLRKATPTPLFYLFDLHPTLAGFGPVYVLNVLFFVSNGLGHDARPNLLFIIHSRTARLSAGTSR